MRALILAAGRGERMRPLTDTVPKPLLPVRGKPLIEWHLEALARAGVREVVVNTAWLEEQFPGGAGRRGALGPGDPLFREGRDHGGALETAGGIRKALPWLAPRGDEAFWVVSGDIYMPGFEFDAALAEGFAAGTDLGLLWLVANPGFHERGDFDLGGRAAARRRGRARTPGPMPTWRCCARRWSPALRSGQRAPLGPLLFEAAAADRLAGRELALALAQPGHAGATGGAERGVA